MTALITAQFVDGDKTSAEFEYYVKNYADYVLANTDNPEYAAAAPLVKAMLNYGACAQIYFDFNTDKLANADLSSEDKTIGKVSFTVDDYDASGLPDDVIFAGSTLSLKSETTLSLYFNADSEPTFACKYPGTNNDMTVETVYKDGYWVARIRGIKAKDIGRWFTLNVNGGSITYSPLNYIYDALNDTRGIINDAFIETMKAMYLYYQAAAAFFP